MTVYIGIDVSSKKLNIHINKLDTTNDYEISNNKESIESFIKEQNLNLNECIVWVESTWRYHLICQEVFILNWFDFRVLNPILTNKKIRTTIRKKKTDESDAKLIAILLAQWEWARITKENLDTDRRSILRTRKSVIDHRSSLKLLVHWLKKLKWSVQIKQAIVSLEKLEEQISQCVDELEDLSLNKDSITETEELISSIPWFAIKLSAIVSTEVWDFERFPTATQFKAYVWIDPKVTQSWWYLKTWKITKRWNPHLREAFYLAAQVARQHDPELIEFYNKKMNEWKHFKVAICAVARKLCERVYSVVKRWIPYEKRELIAT